MRSFLTRLPNSLIGVVLLLSCLLICLACATPFRFARLEEGMTQDEVRAVAGEPRSTWVPDIAGVPPKPGVVEEAWGYRYWLVDEMALYFEDAKLIRQKVYPGAGGYWSPSAPWSTDPFFQGDAGHHALGHTHHHGH